MSFSWSGKKLIKLLTNQRNPSPTYQTKKSDFARNAIFIMNGGSIRRFISDRFTERTSLFTFLIKRMKAGMTVEATIVLPIFLIFMLSMGSALEMIRLHGNLQLSLWDVGRKLALYSYGAEMAGLIGTEEGSGVLQQLGQTIFTVTYVKNQVIKGAGKEYLNSSPVLGGSDGLFMLESDIEADDDCLELYVTYSVQPFGGILANVHFRMANKFYAHVWNGYEIPGADDITQPMVAYLAEHAQVYHLDRKCTHLLLSIRGIHAENVKQVRNCYGKKYEKCEKCVVPTGKIQSIVYYITDDGNCYHLEVNCSGLKRTVRKVSLEEARHYTPCSRCVVRQNE